MGTASIIGLILVVIGGTQYLQSRSILADGYKTRARVVDYERKFRRVGGTWTTLEYPIVEYKDANDSIQNGWVKYASSAGRHFHIDTEIEIIKHGRYIYYAKSINTRIGILAIVGLIIVAADFLFFIIV